MPIPLVIWGVALTASEVATLLGLSAATVGTAVVVTSPGYQEGAQAAAGAISDGLASVFQGDDTRAGAVPMATTNTATRTCDGPHRGRLQVQGYEPTIDPFDFTSARGPSWPWTRPCFPLLRAEGLTALSLTLLNATREIRFASAGLRGPAFAKMSQHIVNAPAIGHGARHTIGWNHLGQRAYGSGRNVPRVDLEVIQGRAFGER